MFCNGTSHLNDWGFLECVGADHPTWHLAGDGYKGDTVEERVRQAADKIGGAGSGGGDADAGLSRGPRVSFGGEDSTLLVPGEDITYCVGARERLVDLHRRTAGIGEHIRDSLPFEGFHKYVSPFARLVVAKTRREFHIRGFGYRRRRSSGGRRGGWGVFGKGTIDLKSRPLLEIARKWEGKSGNG